MTLYSAALFLHVVGSLLLIAALSLEGVGLGQVRRAATPAQVRESAAIAGLTRLVGPASALCIVVPGLYMTATVWGWVPWIVVGLASWAVVGVLGAVNGIRLASAGRAAAGAERLSPDLVARLGDPLLLASWLVRVAMVLGVVFLMTVKPGTVGALLAMASAATVGVGAGLACVAVAARRAVLT